MPFAGDPGFPPQRIKCHSPATRLRFAQNDSVKLLCGREMGGSVRALRKYPTHPAMKLRDEWGTQTSGKLEWFRQSRNVWATRHFLSAYWVIQPVIVCHSEAKRAESAFRLCFCSSSSSEAKDLSIPSSHRTRFATHTLGIAREFALHFPRWERGTCTPDDG